MEIDSIKSSLPRAGAAGPKSAFIVKLVEAEVERGVWGRAGSVECEVGFVLVIY